MIELTGYDSRFDEALKKLDKTIYLEITDHSDVFEDSICIALVDGEFAGAGLLIAEPTFLEDREKKLPIRHIRGDFKAVPGSDYETEVSQALLDDMKESFASIAADYDCGDDLYMRLWCRAGDTAYLDFLYENGFVSLMTNNVMEYDLESGEPDADPSSRVKELLLDDPAETEAYFRSNEGAFGVRDSEEELRFRIRNFEGHVYALMEGNEVAASVTVWDMGDGRAATENIFCHEDHRRQGLTTRLIRAVLDRLKKDGFKKAALTCFGSNLPAMKLYRKLGYETSNVLLGMHYR